MRFEDIFDHWELSQTNGGAFQQVLEQLFPIIPQRVKSDWDSYNAVWEGLAFLYEEILQQKGFASDWTKGQLPLEKGTFPSPVVYLQARGGADSGGLLLDRSNWTDSLLATVLFSELGIVRQTEEMRAVTQKLATLSQEGRYARRFDSGSPALYGGLVQLLADWVYWGVKAQENPALTIDSNRFRALSKEEAAQTWWLVTFLGQSVPLVVPDFPSIRPYSVAPPGVPPVPRTEPAVSELRPVEAPFMILDLVGAQSYAPNNVPDFLLEAFFRPVDTPWEMTAVELSLKDLDPPLRFATPSQSTQAALPVGVIEFSRVDGIPTYGGGLLNDMAGEQVGTVSGIAVPGGTSLTFALDGSKLPPRGTLEWSIIADDGMNLSQGELPFETSFRQPIPLFSGSGRSGGLVVLADAEVGQRAWAQTLSFADNALTIPVSSARTRPLTLSVWRGDPPKTADYFLLGEGTLQTSNKGLQLYGLESVPRLPWSAGKTAIKVYGNSQTGRSSKLLLALFDPALGAALSESPPITSASPKPEPRVIGGTYTLPSGKTVEKSKSGRPTCKTISEAPQPLDKADVAHIALTFAIDSALADGKYCGYDIRAELEQQMRPTKSRKSKAKATPIQTPPPAPVPVPKPSPKDKRTKRVNRATPDVLKTAEARIPPEGLTAKQLQPILGITAKAISNRQRQGRIEELGWEAIRPDNSKPKAPWRYYPLGQAPPKGKAKAKGKKRTTKT